MTAARGADRIRSYRCARMDMRLCGKWLPGRLKASVYYFSEWTLAFVEDDAWPPMRCRSLTGSQKTFQRQTEVRVLKAEEAPWYLLSRVSVCPLLRIHGKVGVSSTATHPAMMLLLCPWAKDVSELLGVREV